MSDLFQDKAAEYDSRPMPQQISEGVTAAMTEQLELSPEHVVLDFGAGTGLVARHIAPRVGRLIAVDISPAMLEQLASKPELADKTEIVCQDLLESPLDQQVDVVVSAMAAHHVQDTGAMLQTLHDHLVPGGVLALADLDAEDGSFHPPGIEGVFHAGFERRAFAVLAESAGFVQGRFVTACEVERDGQKYPIFLFTARRGD